MGYTNYWDRTEKPLTQVFIDGVKRIIKDSEKKGITIRGWDGNGEPSISLDKVSFNGNAEYKLNHETCYFNNREDDRGFGFCKTERKPYDYTVKRVLRLAKKHGIISKWSCDGKCEVVTDEEYLES